MVVVLVVALVAVGAASRSASGPAPDKAGNLSGISSGDEPMIAPTRTLSLVSHVPDALVNSVGDGGEKSSFTVTRGQPELLGGGNLRVVYLGAEFCPWCALMRWSLVMALSRFGTFSGLKLTASAAADGDIPTFSFLGARFESRYLVFTPYEAADRNGAALQAVPGEVSRLYARYDGSGDDPTAFTGGSSPGIPFLDIGDKFVSCGDPASFDKAYSALSHRTPGSVAEALVSPLSPLARSMDARALVAEANFITAAICSADGERPLTVAQMPGVRAAESVLASAPRIG